MRLIGYLRDGGTWVGRVEGDQVVPLGEREEFWRSGGSQAKGGEAALQLNQLTLAPALPQTAKVICIGLNYRAHADEADTPVPQTPVVFSRWRETLIADGEPSPALDALYDWEAELGVVIGSTGIAIDAADARQHIYGYCTFNDLSARTLQMESSQWTLGKNSDRSGPIGAIVTADEAGDPADGWRVTTHVNGELMQDGMTSDFIFTVPDLIAFVSRSMTLQPGDLIITGTPSGVGVARKPPVSLKPGDTVVVEVGALGSVTTPIVARD